MTKGKLILGALVASLVALPQVARAKDGHARLPGLDGKRPGLTMKVLRYTGGTNGKMVVEVRNPSLQTVAFDPTGLYFVPEGDPDKAPQRLGAAGPFEVSEGGVWKSQEKLRVPPGKTAKVQLQVFCIDSHRSSPTASHQFNMAAERLPKNLRREISAGASDALRKSGNRMPAAKSAIQSHIWKTRDQRWIKLEGERRQEKNATPPDQRRYRPGIRRMIRPSSMDQRQSID
ncbi:MAG: hypothetical protein RBU30_08390 [Polyangia bacterium]|jgi:hypothetical protein|nr:hypothetical protein [Polyangia bacterium]